MPLGLLLGCEQYSLLCAKEAEKVSAPTQIQVTGFQPENKNEAALKKQLEQVTYDLVQVKIQRDLLKQELAAYRKRYQEK